jgi:protein-S-isoprenylcysteine O-methyltransferase Ste14
MFSSVSIVSLTSWLSSTRRVPGFGSIIPYFYPLWFALLLILRERRDDRWCAKKYGADWDWYKERVRWRIVPGVY